MSDQRVPAAPAGAKASGKRLWRSILAEYELEEHEAALLREMVRTVDRLDELHGRGERDGVMVRDRLHPAMRLPAGDEESGDAKQGTRRPQRRVGVRGPYRLRGVS
jgi:hypothetical protein